MEGRLTTEKNNIRRMTSFDKNFQPGRDFRKREGLPSVLFRVDVAMTTPEVALCGETRDSPFHPMGLYVD